MKQQHDVGKIVLFMACGALSACAMFTPRETHGPLPAGTFSAALYQQYTRLADENDARNDRTDANHFTRKAHKVADNETVLPDSPRQRGMTATQQHKAAASFRRLRVLLTDDTKRLFPDDLAQAQGMYDCWVAAMKSDRRAHAGHACAAGFEQAMKPLEQHRLAMTDHTGLTLLPAVNSYTVHFATGAAELPMDGTATLDSVAQEAAKIHPAALVLTAYADHATITRTERALLARRTAAVSQALTSRGVTAPLRTVIKTAEPATGLSGNLTISFR
jgi:OOP family OmpA-OmpF porin